MKLLDKFWGHALNFVLAHHPAVRDSNLVRHAETELRAAGWYDSDAFYGDLVPKAALRAVRLFATEGHSGMSAGLLVGITKKLCKFEPLCPLTGDDDEWTEVTEDLWQNRRCSHVFKDASGAYDIEGRIFREPSGACYTNRDSHVPVSFPYSPKREYVDVPEPKED